MHKRVLGILLILSIFLTWPILSKQNDDCNQILKFVEVPKAACSGDLITYKVNDIGALEYYWTYPFDKKEILMDDNDASGIVVHGTWNFAVDSNSFNWEYRVASNVRSDYDIVFKPQLNYSGKYKISISYPALDINNDQTPVWVKTASDIQKILINQTLSPNEGDWHNLGIYDLSPGSSLRIGTDGSGNVQTAVDAVKFELISIKSDTVLSFILKEPGNVCVSAKIPGCIADQFICAALPEPGKLETPVFTQEVTSVCVGKFYVFKVNDIGANSYTWILPEGISLNGRKGTISQLKSTITVHIEKRLDTPVRIGVYGDLTSCNVKSDTAFSGLISTDGCKLDNPVFVSQPAIICPGGLATFSIKEVPRAQQYIWVLPYGMCLADSNLQGNVVTREPYINLTTIDGVSGKIEKISVMAISGEFPSSDLVAADENIDIAEVPDFKILSSKYENDSLNIITICPYGQVELYTSISSKDYSFLWSIDNGTFTANSDSSRIVPVWDNVDETSVQLTMRNEISGCSKKESTKVVLKDEEAPKINECKSSYEVFADFDGNELFYQFTKKDLSSLVPVIADACSEKNAQIDFAVDYGKWFDLTFLEGFQLVKNDNPFIYWKIDDESGNTTQCQTRIEFNFGKLVPNAFSPNDDGINDNWEIDFLKLFPECRILVYNRLGLKVYESRKGYFDYWNGKQSGVLLPVDSYYYILFLDTRSVIKGQLSIVY